MKYYFSLQYSAIQDIVLRHDRLWSMSGISQALSELNEVTLPGKAENHGGTVLIAAGGKFTAVFNDLNNAEKARAEIVKALSTTLPMLEFQESGIVPAVNLREAAEPRVTDGNRHPGLFRELNDQKFHFRGAGLTYNPHLMACKECGEYPATGDFRIQETDSRGGIRLDNLPVCAVCCLAHQAARVSPARPATSAGGRSGAMLEIYHAYLEKAGRPAGPGNDPRVPRNLADLFPPGEGNGVGAAAKRRLAVWASDVNNMGDRVTVWARRPEREIPGIFEEVRRFHINWVSEALSRTFKGEVNARNDENGVKKHFLPFRLIVAGGDDLCVVMDAGRVLEFAARLDETLREKAPSCKFLGEEWLAEKYLEDPATDAHGQQIQRAFTEHSFGGSFVVAPLHSPFRKLHRVAEELLRAAKEASRAGNTVNWLVLSADEDPVSETVLDFEKPVFMGCRPVSAHPTPKISGRLTLAEYACLVKQYHGLSASQRQRIISRVIAGRGESNFPEKLEKWLIRAPEASNPESPVSRLLREEKLRADNDLGKPLCVPRIVTLFELLTI